MHMKEVLELLLPAWARSHDFSMPGIVLGRSDSVGYFVATRAFERSVILVTGAIITV